MSQIIKNGRIRNDRWQILRLAENDDAATVKVPAGRVIVPLGVWQAQRPHLAGRAGAGTLGVWLTGGTDLAGLAENLAALPLIAVDFPEFTDGRGYSIATQLRTRYGYAGELRAIGDVLRDQFLFMIRCGFSTLQPREGRYSRAQIGAALARPARLAGVPTRQVEGSSATAFRRRPTDGGREGQSA